MAPSKIRKVIEAVKDQTSIGLAKVIGSSSISDLEIAIVKATRHGENPPNQCYVAEILSLTCYSRTMVQACVGVIARRLNRTKNWVVALKSLMLVQRLLSKGGSAFEHEIFFTMRRGTRFLNMCDFRDSSSRNAWDYAAFIRAYGLYLDELLELRMQGNAEKGRDCYGHHHSGEEEEDGSGHTSNAIVVRATPVSDMVQVHDIFCRVSKQYDELDSFYCWCKTVGIMRFPDYPNVEKISQPKLEMMDDFIRQKSAMLHDRKACITETKPTHVEEVRTEPIKALPPPEEFVEERKDEVNEIKQEDKKIQEEGDLLNLYDDSPSTQDLGDRLALALFDGYPATTGSESTTPPWEAFNEDDWEMALVQSASHLSNQKPSLPQGLDTLILDGMYQQGTMAHAAAYSGYMATGSASSVALGSAGRPATLALPAPAAAYGGASPFSSNADPFAPSLAIAPPAYVQMTELEKKQRLLLEEQLLWQQYARNGMHGQVGLANLQQLNSYQYIPAGYAASW